MDSDLERLMRAHPALFHGEPPAVPSHLPTGWYVLMDGLCTDLEAMLGPRSERFGWIQIKAKLGSLRAYWKLDESKAIELDLFVGPRPHDATPPHLPGENVEVRATPAGWRLTWVPDGKLEHAIHERIREAEARSESTCAVCGGHGQLWSRDGWLYIACAKHRKPNSVQVGPTDEAGAGGGDV